MTINFKLNIVSLQEVHEFLRTISEIRAELVKKYPDIVVNVEVEIR